MIAAVEIACFYPSVARIANDNTYQNASPDAQVMQDELKRYRASPDRILPSAKIVPLRSSWTEFVELVMVSPSMNGFAS